MTTPTIPAGNLFMNATLYTGTGTTQTITNGVAGQSFAPDFVWAKQRGAATDHVLYDVIRTGTNSLTSNNTAAEVNQTSNGCTVAFNSNGFTAGADTAGYLNYPSRTYVGWQWKAGGTAVSNTNGSITSSVSANTTSGFSVVTYTGNGASSATIGHGLGVAPSMIIVKRRDGVGGSGYDNWGVYHTSLGNTQGLWLQLTSSAYTSAALWNNTSPTSSVFTVALQTGAGYNPSGTNLVAYCWSEVAGYSKFGSYTGNGSADGPFIYLGFKPRFVMIKCSSAAGNDWPIIDTSRATYNVAGPELYADLSQAESTSNYIDIVSNGFKIRSTGGQVNTSATTYIYACFAENPFKYVLAR